MRNHVDLPRLEALNRQWRDFPPLQIQMQRLAMYFGLAPKNQSTEPPTPVQQEQQDTLLAEMFEIRPMPKIMSPEEYLAQRGRKGNEHGL